MRPGNEVGLPPELDSGGSNHAPELQNGMWQVILTGDEQTDERWLVETTGGKVRMERLVDRAGVHQVARPKGPPTRPGNVGVLHFEIAA